MKILPDFRRNQNSDENVVQRVQALENDIRELRAWKNKKNESELELMDQRTGETMRLGNLSTPFSEIHYDFKKMILPVKLKQ